MFMVKKGVEIPRGVDKKTDTPNQQDFFASRLMEILGTDDLNSKKRIKNHKFILRRTLTDESHIYTSIRNLYHNNKTKSPKFLQIKDISGAHSAVFYLGDTLEDDYTRVAKGSPLHIALHKQPEEQKEVFGGVVSEEMLKIQLMSTMQKQGIKLS